MGGGYLNLNQIASAKTIFNRVIQVEPKNYYALVNLGDIAFHLEKNYVQAANYFSRCLDTKSPDYFKTYSNLAASYLMQNQTDKAIENYENALRYGSSPSVLNNLYSLWKSKGNQEKMEYYQSLINKK